MNTPLRTSLLACLVLALTAGAFAACGGGGTGSGSAEPFVADLPETPPLPPMPTTPPDGGVTPVPPPEEPPVDDGEGDGEEPPTVPPPVPPIPPIPPQPLPVPPPPEPLPRWPGLDDVRGVAVNPSDGSVWAVGGEHGTVFRMVPTDPSPQVMGSLQLGGVRGLAFASQPPMLYAIVNGDAGADDSLVKFDPQTFVPETVAVLTGYPQVECLAYLGSMNRLYAVDAGMQMLLRIDVPTGAVTEVGLLGNYGALHGLAPDDEGKRLYGTDAVQFVLVSVDIESGKANKVADLGGLRIEGLGRDPDRGILYGSTLQPPEVFALDPLGAAFGFADIGGLAYDGVNGILFGVYTPGGLILVIDPVTKARRVLGYVPVPGLEGLAFDPFGKILYALSRATRTVYALSPKDAAILRTIPLQGAGAPFERLAGLAFGDGFLFASDVKSGGLLRIEPATGNTVVLAVLADWPGIEGLDFDPMTHFLHAFSNGMRAHIRIDPRGAIRPVVVSKDVFLHVAGLAWLQKVAALLGTEWAFGDLVVVQPPDLPFLGYEDLSALTYRIDSSLLLGFDAPLNAFVEIDPLLKVGFPIETWPDVRIDAMTFDADRSVVVAIDAQQGNVYEIAPDKTSTAVGPPHVLSAWLIRALAYDPQRKQLWGVDDATDRLVALDVHDGTIDVIERPETLGFASVEAIVFDEATGKLLGLDRTTRSLLEIDRETGAATRFATVEADDVRDMTMVPGSAVLWLTDGNRIVAIDRFTGGMPDPALGLAFEPSKQVEPEVRLLWPRGDVTRRALASCAIEVRPGADGKLQLELACDGEVLHQGLVEPAQLLTRIELPEAVQAKLVEGKEATWRIGRVSAAFRVVDGASAHGEIQRILAQPSMAAAPELARRVVEAWLLDRYRLHSEALLVGMETYEAYPTQRLAALSLLRTLDCLGLTGTELGRELCRKVD